MPSEEEKGVVKPLAQQHVPFDAWRVRDVGEPRSRLVMQAAIPHFPLLRGALEELAFRGRIRYII